VPAGTFASNRGEFHLGNGSTDKPRLTVSLLLPIGASYVMS
jgi:hypothetical protein